MMSQQQKLHVGYLVRADQSRSQEIAQISQINIHRPVLVVGTPAVLLEARECFLNGIARSTEQATG